MLVVSSYEMVVSCDTLKAWAPGGRMDYAFSYINSKNHI